MFEKAKVNIRGDDISNCFKFFNYVQKKVNVGSSAELDLTVIMSIDEDLEDLSTTL